MNIIVKTLKAVSFFKNSKNRKKAMLWLFCSETCFFTGNPEFPSRLPPEN